VIINCRDHRHNYMSIAGLLQRYWFCSNIRWVCTELRPYLRNGNNINKISHLWHPPPSLQNSITQQKVSFTKNFKVSTLNILSTLNTHHPSYPHQGVKTKQAILVNVLTCLHKLLLFFLYNSRSEHHGTLLVGQTTILGSHCRVGFVNKILS